MRTHAILDQYAPTGCRGGSTNAASRPLASHVHASQGCPSNMSYVHGNPLRLEWRAPKSDAAKCQPPAFEPCYSLAIDARQRIN